jgi:hypothetical protein
VTISVADRSETLCENATLTDSTKAEPPRISSFVPPSRSDLEFPACYDIDDIFMFLHGFKPAHQFARLVAEGYNAESLEIFSEYMLKKTQVLSISSNVTARC